MKSKRRDGSTLRSVLAAMVVDRTVCSRIASQWPEHGGLFDAPWANLVGSWCVKYLNKYGEPPNGRLRSLFEDWAETTKAPEETVRGVEQFLEVADDERTRAEQEQLNSGHLLDQADRYFNAVRMRQVVAQMEDLLDLGCVAEAQDVLNSTRKIELSASSVVKVVSDWDAFRKAWDEDRERPLVSYPNLLQGFLGRWLQRDALIGFMAPDKAGKSVFLLDLAVRATRNRCRVAYFDTGDNSQDQVIRRLGARVARRPVRETFAKRIKVPIDVDGDGEVESKFREFQEPVGAAAAYSLVRRLCRGVDRLRVTCYPNSTASVVTLASRLTEWEQEDGWVPDVVVIDYADILAPPPGVRETLDQIDETWKQLRRLSQERHCLVATATQASAAAYSDKAKVLKKQHFSGRKTKLAHVNGMVGINVSDKDRKAGVSRLNWVVRREGSYSESQQVIIAGCWAWYDPAIRVSQQSRKRETDEL